MMERSRRCALPSQAFFLLEARDHVLDELPARIATDPKFAFSITCIDATGFTAWTMVCSSFGRKHV